VSRVNQIDGRLTRLSSDSLHAAVELPPAVVGGLGYLQHPADLGDGFPLSDQLLRSLELADDLLGFVVGSFHGGVPGPAWPAEDSHSPWIDFWEPRQNLSRKNQTTS